MPRAEGAVRHRLLCRLNLHGQVGGGRRASRLPSRAPGAPQSSCAAARRARRASRSLAELAQRAAAAVPQCSQCSQCCAAGGLVSQLSGSFARSRRSSRKAWRCCSLPGLLPAAACCCCCRPSAGAAAAAAVAAAVAAAGPAVLPGLLPGLLVQLGREGAAARRAATAATALAALGLWPARGSAALRRRRGWRARQAGGRPRRARRAAASLQLRLRAPAPASAGCAACGQRLGHHRPALQVAHGARPRPWRLGGLARRARS